MRNLETGTMSHDEWILLVFLYENFFSCDNFHTYFLLLPFSAVGVLCVFFCEIVGKSPKIYLLMTRDEAGNLLLIKMPWMRFKVRQSLNEKKSCNFCEKFVSKTENKYLKKLNDF